MDLGLAQEKAGQLKEAEASLIQAVALERTGAPRGILAEFYFRQHATAKFWPAARDAIQHSYLDLYTLFQDCWALTSDENLILEKAIPEDGLVPYLNYLMTTNRLEPAIAVSERIMKESNPTEAAKPLLALSDRLTLNMSSQAVVIWNWLCQRRFVPYPPIEDQRCITDCLTNGDFTSPPLATGFDWRLTPPQGVYLEALKGAISLTFTGDQPENCEFLSQFVFLEPNRRYRLTVDYTTSDIEKPSGLTWRLLFAGKDLLDNSGMLTGGASEFSRSFDGPLTSGLGKLALSYERVKGTVRITGSAQIKKVRIAFTQ
jgi:hypothetical protein